MLFQDNINVILFNLKLCKVVMQFVVNFADFRGFSLNLTIFKKYFQFFFYMDSHFNCALFKNKTY